MENIEQEYLKDFNLNELYILLNAVSQASLYAQLRVWQSNDEKSAKANKDSVFMYNGLAEKIKFKIDTFKDNPNEN